MAANVDFYANSLRNLLSNPGSYSGSPGFQFALDSGTQAINRNNSAQRGSGNVLAELMKYGTGLASQDYGNQVDRLGRLSGQEQQYNLGLGQNANQSTRNANDFALGNRNADNTLRSNDQSYGLGLYRANNDYNLGQGQLSGQNWQRAADYSLGQSAADTNRLNAWTNRGRALSDSYYTGDASNRAWWNTVG